MWTRHQNGASVVLVLKSNGKVQLCLDPASLNKVLIRPVHRGLTLNNILQRLTGIRYLMLIDASLSYHNLKLCHTSFRTIMLFDSSPSTLSLTLLLLTINFTHYCMTCAFSLESQDQDTECPDLYLQIYSCYGSGQFSKICKRNKKEKARRAHMQLIHVLTKL